MRYSKFLSLLLMGLGFLAGYSSIGQPKIWATSSYGGNGGGMIYKINPDGSNFLAIKNFDGDVNGRNPIGGNFIKGSDGNFYGVVGEGGLNNTGVILRINGSDKSFVKLFDFDADGVNTGKAPTGSLIQANNGVLYGMTSSGGATGEGVIYKINVNGTGFVKLVDFDAVSKGNNPVYSSLIQCADGYLYGIAQGGNQTPRAGVIFKMSLAGVYQKIFDFEQATTGLNPVGSLLEGSDGKLYGMTSSNVNNKGTIFKVELNGTGFSTLHEFTAAIDGESPVGSLVEGAGGYLYGVTSNGGVNGQGVIFRLSKAVSTYQKLIDLQYSDTGSFPRAGIIMGSDGRMYGGTGYGGNNNKGVIFSLAADGTDFKKITDLSGSSGSFITGALAEVDSENFITFCYQGGSGKGTIINANVTSGTVSKVFDFYSPNDGQIPGDLVQLPSGEIFGNAFGGAYNQGVIYKINPNGTGYTKLLDFDGQSKGSNPGPLVQGNDGFLYGMCRFGGISEMGTIFKIKPDGTGFVKMFDFSFNEGGRPRLNQSLSPLPNGDLIGAAEQGGSNSAGVIFKIKNDGNGYTKLFDFGGTSGTGPTGKLVPDGNGFLYGTTVGGGANGFGTIFKLNLNSGAFVKIYDFTQSSQAHGLMFTPNNFVLGITSFGGSNNQGSIFKINADGSGFQTLHSFDLTLNPASGFWPFTDFTDEINGFAYGLTFGGGPYQLPTLYKIGLDGLGFQEIVNFSLADKAGTGGSPIVVHDKQFQQITFSPFSNKTFGDAPFSLSSTATSGLTTSYVSTNTSVATIVGNVVTIVGAGTTNIIAKQDGNATYFAAPNVIIPITVAPNQTITFNPLPLFTIGDTPFIIATSMAFASSGLQLTFTSSNASVATISGNVITLVGAGTSTITAFQAGNVNFSTASAQQSITIRPIPTIVITSNATGGFGTIVKLVTNKGGSTGDVTYSISNGTGSATLNGDLLSLTSIGTVTVTSNVAGDDNYGQGIGTQEITIQKGIPVLSISLPSNCIVGSSFTLSIDKGGATGTVAYSIVGGTGIALLSGNSLTATGSGTVLLKAVVSEDINYLSSELIKTLVISPSNLAKPGFAQIWGVTGSGGISEMGVVFSANSDGTGYSVKHEFNSDGNGSRPYRQTLMQASNGKLYGTTNQGGIYNNGVLFEYNPSTSNYSKKVDFNMATIGAGPVGVLIEATNGKLYGVTAGGGINNNGTLFQYDPISEELIKKVDFSYNSIGSTPLGTLALSSNGKIHGIAPYGGANDKGVLFEYDPMSNQLSKKLDFDGVSTGSIPLSGLTIGSNGKVYGLTSSGGTNNVGVLYEFDPSTNGFTNVHDFSQAESGGYLEGGLIATEDGMIIGTTIFGGIGSGTIFLYDIALSSFSQKYVLTNSVNGQGPQTLVKGTNGKFYGITSYGGPDSGVIFEYDLASNVYTKLTQLGRDETGNQTGGSLTLGTNGKFYGLTPVGGNGDVGTIFEFNPMNNVLTKKYDFSFAQSGARPTSSLTKGSNEKFYGIAGGGLKNKGVIFEFDPITNQFKKKHDFSSEVIFPGGGLTKTNDGRLFGTCGGGGANGAGTLYEYELATNSVIKKIDFDLPITGGGANDGGLMLAQNGKLYGLNFGGVNYSGALTEYDPTTNQLLKKFDFEQTTGTNPVGVLTQTPTGKMYGVTNLGGANSFGVLFEYDPSTSTYTKKIDFVGGAQGSFPSSSLLFDNGKLYGLTQGGGINGAGILFEFDPVNNVLIKKADFSPSINGRGPRGSIIIGSKGKFYGVTESGGLHNRGVLFEYDPTTSSLLNKYNFISSQGSFPSGFLTLIKLKQSISFETLSERTFGETPYQVTAASTSGLSIGYTSSNTSVATISGSTITIVGAGTTTITARQLGDYDFEPVVSVEQVLNVKNNQTITFSTLSNKTFGDPSFGLNATTTSGLPITYTSSNELVATVLGNTVTIVGAGTTTINAKQAGNANYNAATDVPQNLTVLKADQTITFTSLLAKTFGDTPFTLSASTTSGLPITYTSSNELVATVSGNTVTIIGAGTTSIAAKQAGNSNYNAASDLTQTLTVLKANQTITFSTLSNKTFGDPSFGLTTTSTSGLPITYTGSNELAATVSGNTVTIIGAGTAAITAKQAGNANYNAATDVTQTLTVLKADQVITFTSLLAKTFGDTPFTLSATTTSGLPLAYTSSNELVATVSGNTVTIVGGGSITITAKQAGNANYNSATDVIQNLTVAKASQTISFSSLPTKVLGNAPFNLSATSTSGLAIQFSTTSNKVTLSGNQVTLVNPGSVAIKADQTGNSNFDVAVEVSQSFCINPAKPTITSSGLTSGSPVLTSSSATGNQWYRNGTLIADAISNTFTPTDGGSYTVKVTVDNCSSELSAEQILVITGDISSSSKEGFFAYPNPTSNTLTINLTAFDTSSEVGIVVYDLSGKVMDQLFKRGEKATISVGSYSAGVFFIKASQQSRTFIAKFEKQ